MNIRQKTVLPTLGTLVFFGFLLVMAFSWYFTSLFEEKQKEYFSTLGRSISSAQKRTEQNALQLALLYANNPEVKEIYRNAVRGDAGNSFSAGSTPAGRKFYDFVSSVFPGSDKDREKVPYHLHFHLSDGPMIWRYPQSSSTPETDACGFFPLKSRSERLPGSLTGLEGNGVIISGIAPVKDTDGHYLGYVEIRFNLWDILKAVTAGDKQEYALLADKQLAENTIISPDKRLSVLDNRFALLRATNRQVIDRYMADKRIKINSLQSNAIQIIDTYAFAAQPIIDHAGWQIGLVLPFRDVAGQLASISSARWFMAVTILIMIILLGFLVQKVTNNFVRPLIVLRDVSEQMARGDLNFEFEIKRNDELGDLAASVKKLAKALRDKAQSARDIARGFMDTKIDVTGEADVLGNAMEDMRARLNSVLNRLHETIEAQKEGDIDARCNTDGLEGAYLKLLNGVNQALDTVVTPLREISEILQKYAHGDLNADIPDLPGKQKIVSDSILLMRQNLDFLVSEAVSLTRKAEKGNLQARGNAEQLQGGYKDIINGFNRTLDAIINPFNVAYEYIQKIGKGEIPPKIEEQFPGDFAIFVESINACIDSLDRLISEADTLIENAVNGNLSYRADADGHYGDYKKIIEGFNKTLNAIVVPIQLIQETLRQLARGDLTVKMEGQFNGDFAKMKNTLEFAIGEFSSVLSNVQMAIEQVNMGAEQVALSSQAVSQGTTEQASSLEETNASLLEVNGQAKQNAQSAIQAKELARLTTNSAQTGGELMNRMMEAMAEINGASEQISRITKVIDEIAFQTNLLALNAAVEAARAGVHGKGFAVVAEEVRNLAQRSAKAAQEITTIIEDSVNKVQNGISVAVEADSSLADINENSAKLKTIIEEIAQASEQQVAALEQINEALNQIDNATQANAASSEESASAAEELSGQATELGKLIRQFKLTKRSAQKRKAAANPKNGTVHSGSGNYAVQDERPNNANGNGRRPDPMELVSLDEDDFADF